MTEMTDERLAEIEARCNATGSEMWDHVICDDGRHMVATPGDTVCLSDPNHEGAADEPNMVFIAWAHQDIPALIAEVRRLRDYCRETMREAADDRKMRQRAIRNLLNYNKACRGYEKGIRRFKRRAKGAEAQLSRYRAVVEAARPFLELDPEVMDRGHSFPLVKIVMPLSKFGLFREALAECEKEDGDV